MSLTPIDLYQRHQKEFDRYQSLLLKWNEKINLTSITKPQEVIEKHFIDSLSLLGELGRWISGGNVSRETFLEKCSMLDIGSGAGFPGIPIKIASPQLRLTLIDSVKKKCDFMKEVVRALSLSEVDVQHCSLLEGQTLGQFDLVVTRATFPLKDFVGLAVSNLAPRGRMIAFKGPEVRSEVEDAATSLSKYSLRPFELRAYEHPYSKASRTLVMTRFV